jgi:hypothetical protein
MIKDANGDWVDPPFTHHFGLSYAHYLVLPRSILEAMPEQWQTQMIELLDQAADMLKTDEINDNYTVTLRDERGRFVKDQFANYRHPVEIPFKFKTL